jgi:ATP-dependent RNA helicase DeaD
MLDYGFAPDVERIIARTTPDRQTALFSATVPDWVRTTATKHLNDPVTVAVASTPEDAASIEHVAFDVADTDKIGVLKDLLSQPAEGRRSSFGRTKRGVARLARKLQADGFPVLALQGDMAQGARDRVMAEFRAGGAPILVATNVAARGIDVTNVERVINVELPESPALLTHRNGRTGRMGRQGQAITLIGPEDGPKWRQLEKGLTARIARVPWPGAAAAVAGGFEIAEPAPQPAAGSRRTTRGGRQDRPAMTGAPRPNPRQEPATPARPSSPPTMPGPSRPEGEVVWRSGGRQNQSTASQGSRPAAVAERVQPGPVADHAAGTPPSRGRRFPAPSGAPKVKAAMAARAAAGSWGAYDAAGGSPVEDVAVADAAVPTAVLCSGCGQAARVPFDPDPSRPVYCASCFAERRSSRRPAAGAGARAGDRRRPVSAREPFPRAQTPPPTLGGGVLRSRSDLARSPSRGRPSRHMGPETDTRRHPRSIVASADDGPNPPASLGASLPLRVARDRSRPLVTGSPHVASDDDPSGPRS